MDQINKNNYSIDYFHNSKIIGEMPPLPIPGSWQKFHRANLIKCSLEQTVGSGYICEFGVLKGRTLNQIADFFKNKDVHGFDSFKGLPEPWHMTDDRVFPKGQMSLGGNLPEVLPNVKLVVGWYDKTLPGWIDENSDVVKFIHIDCDLCSSTETVLTLLNNQIVPGTIIHFDDFYCWGNPEEFTKWQDGEYLALQHWIEKFDRTFEILHRNNYFQCAIRIIK